MKSSILIVVLFQILSTSFIYAGDKHYVTMEQQRFADSVTRDNADVITSSWLSERDLWVESIKKDEESADKLAMDIVKQGHYIQRSFCVIIHHGDYKELAKHCIEK